MSKFKKKDGVLIGCTAEESYVAIPTGVTEIGANAFNECVQVREVVIPEGVTKIGNKAFKGCFLLTSVVIPDSVREIGMEAFRGCSMLSEVTLPEGLAVIGLGAFSYCAELARINLPDSLTHIGRMAFFGCSSLTEITVPRGVKTLEEGTFGLCGKLERAVISEGVEVIDWLAFLNCPSLEEIFIPKSVNSIRNAFLRLLGGVRIYAGASYAYFFEDKEAWEPWAATVRGYLARYYSERIDEAEAKEWREYIDSHGAAVLNTFPDDLLLYRYLTENNLIPTECVTEILERVRNIECRAILLDYSNKRRDNKNGTDGAIDKLLSLDDR